MRQRWGYWGSIVGVVALMGLTVLMVSWLKEQKKPSDLDTGSQEALGEELHIDILGGGESIADTVAASDLVARGVVTDVHAARYNTTSGARPSGEFTDTVAGFILVAPVVIDFDTVYKDAHGDTIGSVYPGLSAAADGITHTIGSGRILEVGDQVMLLGSVEAGGSNGPIYTFLTDLAASLTIGTDAYRFITGDLFVYDGGTAIHTILDYEKPVAELESEVQAATGGGP